jgi:hypothetical protein
MSPGAQEGRTVMIPGTRRSGDPARTIPEPQPADRGFRGTLGELFPLPPEAPTPTWDSRTLSVVAQVAAVGLGTVVLLMRVPGLPPWDTIYGEDYWEFFTQAIQQPWHLFITYNGYWQFLPRLIAQFVRYLPLAQASRAFAVSGAVIAACCALFIFHASAGHIRSVKLRALLAAALVLLPAAPMEIIDSGVNTPWYLLPVLFWAALWRPRTRTGMAVAAVLAFVAAASNILSVPFAPLLAVRLYVLRSPREHAVTAGWLAGCLAQVPFVIAGTAHGDARLATHATPGQSLAFYGHDVVLPSLGWHLSWWLRSFAGANGATAIAAVVLAVVFGVILVSQVRARAFVVTALVIGFVVVVVGITLNGHLVTAPLLPDGQFGNRYTVLPIFLIEAAVIVGVDYALRRRGRGHRRPGAGPKPAMALMALVAVLAATWAVDFRYAGWRSRASWTWAPIAAKWEHDCAHSQTGEIVEKIDVAYQTLPCRNIRP